MNWYKNLKIGTKLVISFLLIAVLAAAMAVFAIFNLQSLSKSDKELYNNMTVPLQIMSNISQSFQRQRVEVRQAIISTDPKVIADQLQKIEDRRSEIDTFMPQFEARILSDSMRQLFDKFKTAKDAYRPLADKIIERIKAGDMTMAAAMVADDSEAGVAARAEQDAIDAILTAKTTDAEAKSNANTTEANTTIIIMIIVAAAVVALAVLIGIVISRMISKPIAATAACAKAIASGDLNALLNVKSKDETGQLASTIDVEVRQAFIGIEEARELADKQSRYQKAEVDKLLVNLKRLARGELYCDIVVADSDQDTKDLHDLFTEIAMNLCGGLNEIKSYINEISKVLGEMSDGNLDVGIEKEYIGDFAELKRSINNIIESLNKVMSNINVAAEQVAAGTKQVSDGSQQISQGATEQASSIEELTVSSSQIGAQTRQNALSANNANELTSEARKGALKGNEQMKNMQRAMEEINESSENISKIIKVIDDIAFQTNILALNAAVEAARAGVHGKGFAVVAEEVRNLAARSASAAKETTELIEGSIKKTAMGKKIADDTAAALDSIVMGVEKSGELVSEIASASNEQATAISQVSNGIEQMSQVVQSNSATAEEAAAAAEELSSQAEMLKGLVSQFRIKAGDRIYETTKQTVDAKRVNKIGRTISLSEPEFGKY